ncbi:hypothetical protein V2J94_37845 [Streptomyces sp. DSM 41524]|uniref:Uncharacterized protein n=1 Tax=Streptomyces asiaticus subsp. ignotus TaxID=3098222 RepID=A0ABU7Q9F7_9ACTN|nr:hypothetical protein [Streptomyces sp. DSM 41524]
MATALEHAAGAVRQGADVGQVLAEVRCLLPEPADAHLTDGDDDPPASGKAERLNRVREWYLALPDEIRGWSSHAIVADRGYAAALGELTGVKVDTVRTEYLNPIRRELGEGVPQPPQAKG